MERYRRPAKLLCDLLDTLLGLDEVNRYLAGHLSALDTAYPPDDPAAHPLTGRRMPDTTLSLPNGARTRPSELLHDARFVLLHLGGRPTPRTDALPGPVRPVTATADEEEGTLNGITEVLVRPDGHVAWATLTTAPEARAVERRQALGNWIRVHS